MRFSGVLLDLDNTVYSYDVAHAAALEKTLPYLAKELKQPIEEMAIAYEVARKTVKKRVEGFAAAHSRLLYFQAMCEHFKAPISDTAIVAEDLYWQTFFDHMVLRKSCLEFLHAIRPMPVVVVTDQAARLQLKKILHLNLQTYIFAVVSSEEAGYEKPHPRIFELAAEKLAADPSQLCMIGDDWKKDIEGALHFNMRCYWFRDGVDSIKLQDRPLLGPPIDERVREFSEFSQLVLEVAPVV